MEVTLSAEQVRIVNEVAANGVATSTVDSLLRDEPCYPALRDLALSFADSSRVREQHAAFLRGEKRNSLKQFLVKYQDQQNFKSTHPLFQFGLLPGIHETACACLGHALTYYSADMWCVLPNSIGKEREWSQNWHRDPEAERLIKVFLFVEDVTNDNGPFEYVARSHNGGYAQACEPKRYADQQYVAESIPAEDKRRFCAPAGTVVFADTSGLHRGGYTRSKRRLSCIWTFLPNRPPKFQLESEPTWLSAIQRSALCLN